MEVSKYDIAKKVSLSGVKVSAMSVSRLLMALTGKDFLKRAGNGYEPTDLARTRPQQRTL